MNAQGIGILGGSFDPIHMGHVSLARSALEYLPLASLLVMPAKDPPHKAGYITSEEDRLAMLGLVFNNWPKCRIDERELRIARTSYSVLTMRELRQEVGSDVPLCFIMGWDSIQALATWWQWRDLFQLVNIAVAHRPGYGGFDCADVQREMDARMVDIESLCQRPAGAVAYLPMTDQAVASSEIRTAIARRNRTENFENNVSTNDSVLLDAIPNVVADYITQHGLYADT